MSCVFAPEITIASGSPFSSTKTLRFVPIFSSARWILSNGLQCKRHFDHTAVHALPLPADSFQLIVLFQTCAPNFLKETGRQPFLKPSVHRAAASVFTGQGLPLAAGPKYIKYPLQRFSRWHWFPPLTGGILVFLCWIPLFFGISPLIASQSSSKIVQA